LVSAGEGADPGFFYVDSKTGVISALPRSNGNYTLFLIVDGSSAAGTATSHDLPPQLDQVIVKRLDFTVVGKPDFDVTSYTRKNVASLPRVASGESPYIDMPKVGVKECLVGTMYHIAPIDPSTLVYAHASGGDDATIHYTMRNPPPGFFIDPVTGEIQGNPQESSAGTTIKSTLLAVDPGGQEAVLEVMHFGILPQPVFGLNAIKFDPLVLSPQEVGLESVSALFDSTSTIQYAVNSTIKFPPLLQSTAHMFVNPAFDDFTKITYKRTFSSVNASESTNPGLWLVDTETGEMLAQPEYPGNYSVSLIATDGRGAEVVVRNWSFEVLLRDTDVPEYGPNNTDCKHNGVREDDTNLFDRQFACICIGTGFHGDNCENAGEGTCAANEALVEGGCKPFHLVANRQGIRTAAGAEFTDPMNTTYYTVREFASYRIAPLAIDDVLTKYSAGNQADLSYTMAGDAGGFFLNTQTGHMLGTFEDFGNDKSATKTYSITLQAVDASGIQQELETMQMQVRYPDVEVDAYGPNQQPCDNNGTRMNGMDGYGDEYDQSYVCKCISTSTIAYSGANCEVGAQQQSATGDVGAVAGGLIATFVMLLLVGYGAYQYRVKQLSMQAFDFEAHLAELLASGAIDAGHVDAADNEGSTGPKVPREIKRLHVTMIDVVGSGQFGEVWKAVLDESSTGGVPGYTVAVKTSKEATGEGADEMTKEALVMAQVTGHPNVVALVGVVTSGVPLLLLLSYCEHGSLKSALEQGICPGQENVAGAPPAPAKVVKIALQVARGMVHLVEHRFVHRDLAARNVLLDAEFTCKVADFGLSRGVVASASGDTSRAAEYYTSHGGAFPVRWTAPEAMENMKFSTTTDVWSYGVVLLEIVMGGATPYPELDGNEAVMSKIMSGYRTPQPAGCTDQIYAIMYSALVSG
jgi:hypothetical protein